MKKTRFLIATLLVVMATAVAVVSCKKDNQNVKSIINNGSTVSHFDPSHITDMNGYLADFKQKMKESQYSKDDEAFSLDEAAWHLSSVANYDFANANVEFDDIRFDTIYSTVNITGGFVLMSDLAAAYENISTDIEKFYRSLSLGNKHFRFIGAKISENGAVTISLVTTFLHNTKYLDDTLWYYPNMESLLLECYWYFSGYSSLPANSLGTSVLQSFLNWKESHQVVEEPTHLTVYYTATFDTTFYYRNEIDPFGSPSYLNSRLFANNTYLNIDILPVICYYVDSYAGLGYSNCPSGQNVVYWKIRYYEEEPFPQYEEHLWKEHHRLTVSYGIRHEINPNPGGGGF